MVAFGGGLVLAIALLAAYIVVRKRFPHAMAWVRRSFFAVAVLMTVAYAGFTGFLFYGFGGDMPVGEELTPDILLYTALPLLLPISLLLFVAFVIDRRRAEPQVVLGSPTQVPSLQPKSRQAWKILGAAVAAAIVVLLVLVVARQDASSPFGAGLDMLSDIGEEAADDGTDSDGAPLRSIEAVFAGPEAFAGYGGSFLRNVCTAPPEPPAVDQAAEVGAFCTQQQAEAEAAIAAFDPLTLDQATRTAYEAWQQTMREGFGADAALFDAHIRPIAFNARRGECAGNRERECRTNEDCREETGVCERYRCSLAQWRRCSTDADCGLAVTSSCEPPHHEVQFYIQAGDLFFLSPDGYTSYSAEATIASQAADLRAALKKILDRAVTCREAAQTFLSSCPAFTIEMAWHYHAFEDDSDYFSVGGYDRDASGEGGYELLSGKMYCENRELNWRSYCGSGNTELGISGRASWDAWLAEIAKKPRVTAKEISELSIVMDLYGKFFGGSGEIDWAFVTGEDGIAPHFPEIVFGKDERNGVAIESKYFCSDLCPDYGFNGLYYRDIPKGQCAGIGGEVSIDAGWGGYIGCEVPIPK